MHCGCDPIRTNSACTTTSRPWTAPRRPHVVDASNKQGSARARPAPGRWSLHSERATRPLVAAPRSVHLTPARDDSAGRPRLRRPLGDSRRRPCYDSRMACRSSRRKRRRRYVGASTLARTAHRAAVAAGVTARAVLETAGCATRGAARTIAGSVAVHAPGEWLPPQRRARDGMCPAAGGPGTNRIAADRLADRPSNRRRYRDRSTPAGRRSIRSNRCRHNRSRRPIAYSTRAGKSHSGHRRVPSLACHRNPDRCRRRRCRSHRTHPSHSHPRRPPPYRHTVRSRG